MRVAGRDVARPAGYSSDRRRGRHLIGVLGPARASLYELIDARTLDALEPVGDLGALVVISSSPDDPRVGT